MDNNNNIFNYTPASVIPPLTFTELNQSNFETKMNQEATRDQFSTDTTNNSINEAFRKSQGSDK